MATQVTALPVGTPIVARIQNSPMQVQVQPGAAGTVLIEYSGDGVNYTAAPQGASTSPYSFCTGTYPSIPLNGYIRMTAATTAGVGLISDMAILSGPTSYDRKTLCMTGVPYPKQSSTSEQAWISYRFPVGYLKPNFRLEYWWAATLTNGANVKTLRVYFGNSATTALEGGTVLTGTPNVYTSMAGAWGGGFVAGHATANTVYGSNPGLLSAGGFGSSTTANVNVSNANANYAGGAAVEQALVLTVQTATTAGDLFTLDAFKLDIIQ